jgi:transcriptional antiterminator/mannitol/fructose-specific phosphotransferase system IIA component (Ntr-type)
MLPLDHRHIEILGILLESPKPLSAKLISQSLNTTPRVIRYHLNQLEKWLKTKDINLVQQSGVGIFMEVSDDQKNQLGKELKRGRQLVPHYLPDDRLHILLFNLITQSGVTVVKQYQSQLGVARTTILKDLQKVEDWLSPYNIELCKRQNFGCYLQGNEINYRKAIVSLLIEIFGEVELLSIYGDLAVFSPDRVQRYGNKGIFIDYLKSLQLKFFDDLVNQIQEINHKIFTDRGRMILSLQLATSIKRLKNRWTVDIPLSEINLLRLDTDFHLSATLVEKTSRYFGLSIPEPEIAYQMLRIKEAEIRRQIINPALIQEINNSEGDNINPIVDSLLGYLALYLHPALRLDQKLKNDLVSHFRNLMESPSTNSHQVDPLLEDMKRVYPETYRITRDSVMEVNQKLEKLITDEEIGYITMHLVAAMERLRMRSRMKKKAVVICNGGGATSQLLASRVITEFPDVEITGVLSYLEYKNNNKDYEHDFIITTFPIPPMEKPSVVVGPLLGQNDVNRIRSATNRIDHRDSDDRDRELDKYYQASLSDLLSKETIELQGIARTWEELIDIAGNLIMKTGAISPSYINAMKSVREEYGPYMVIMPGLALLHAFPGDGVKRLCMSMVTLKTPVNFGHNEFDPVSLAFALGAVDNHSHLRALSEMVEIVKDPRTVAALCNTSIKSKALNIISRFSHNVIANYPIENTNAS